MGKRKENIPDSPWNPKLPEAPARPGCLMAVTLPQLLTHPYTTRRHDGGAAPLKWSPASLRPAGTRPLCPAHDDLISAFPLAERPVSQAAHAHLSR